MKKDTILLLGNDGYIGTALTLRLLGNGYNVIGVDSEIRRHNVKKMGSFSAIPIDMPLERVKKYKEMGNFEYYPFDISRDYQRLRFLIEYHQPHTIVNLAQQPSAPFSHRSLADATETIMNNELGILNILEAIRTTDRDIPFITIGSMGEYDQSMGVDIEEGVFDFHHNGKVAENVIYPRRAMSFYHGSKIASTYYTDLASRSYGIRATDIMQGIVYGNWTDEIEYYGINTRLDSDESFGTVINRFIVQAVLGHPLTIYGAGEQQRGFLALNDSIQCLMLAIENPPDKGEYRTWNQLDTPYSINMVAETIRNIINDNFRNIIHCGIQHIDTPRAENTSNVYYHAKVDKLEQLGFDPTRTIEDEVNYIIPKLMKLDLAGLGDVVMPRIVWRKE
jgi:UDP-sulfoquinovose synthase